MGRFVALLVVASTAMAAPASADVFKLYAEGQGGGMYGQGLAGEQQDDAFFAKSRGAGYGALVGGQFLIFDGHIKHNQYIKSGELTTWTQFNAGVNFAIDTGTPEAKKAHKGGYLELGVFAGFGLGTGAQVDPPLDNSEITDKGFLLEAKFGGGKHLSKIFDIGVSVPMSWGYFFKSGSGAAANDESTQYQSMQINVLLVLRANIRFI